MGLKGIHSDTGNNSSIGRSTSGVNATVLPSPGAAPPTKMTIACGPLVRVEQKNYATVRKIVGYFRYQGAAG
jgi:hypothetical protein